MATKADGGKDGATKSGKDKLRKGMKRPKPAPFALEPRYVFDAAAAGELAQAGADNVAPQALERAAEQADSGAKHSWMLAPESIEDGASGLTVDKPLNYGAKYAAAFADLEAPARGHGDAERGARNTETSQRSIDADREADDSSHASANDTHEEADLWLDTIDAMADDGGSAESKTLYVVDSRVADLDWILSRLPADSVLVLDPTRDGIDQVTDFLSDHKNVATLAFISDGAPGRTLLGSTQFDADAVKDRAAQVSLWADALTEEGDIILLGCDVADGAAGDKLLQRLADLTGADVAGSDDLTGSAELGGDLTLERHVGSVEQASLDKVNVLEGYDNVLTLTGLTVTNSAGGLTAAELSGGLEASFTAGKGNSDGKQVLLVVKSGANILYWEIFSPNITNGAGSAYTILTQASPLGNYSGNITIEVSQGTGTVGRSSPYSGSFATTPTFTATSGTLNSLSTTYTGANQAPTAVADTGSAGENETKSFDVLANDTDPNAGDTKTISTLGTVSVTSANGSINGINAASAFSLSAATANNQIVFTPGTLFDGLAAGQTATVTVQYTMRDTAGATSNSTLTLTVTGTNDGAVIGNPTIAAVTEDVGASGGNLTASGSISISDADTGQAAFQTGVSSTAGNLGSLALNANGTYTYTVSNAAAQYLGTGQTKVDTFTVTATDGTTKVVSFTVNGANDAPVAVTDSVTTSEGSAVNFDPRSNDTDADTGATRTITHINGTAVSSGGSVALASGAGTVILNANGTLTYTPAGDYNGTPSFSYTISDGQGGTATGTVNVTVTAVNDAPVNVVPGTQSVLRDASLAISGLSITDVDAASGSMTTTLSVANGQLTVANVSGGASVAGTGTGTVTLTGTLAQINATLAASGAISYRGNSGFTGSDTLTMTTSDGGNTGSGGALTDTDTVSITVEAAPAQAPVNSVPGAQTTAEDTAKPISGVSVADGDSATLTTTLTVTNGSLSVTVGGGASIGGNGTGTVTLSGSAAQINAALAGLSYQPTGNFSGAATLSITTSDGALTDTDTVAITVTAVNDAPVLDATKSPVLTAVAQTAGAPSGAVGTRVSDLLTGAVTDAEGAAAGIALTALNTTNGTWHYSLNGSTWTAVGAVSESSALLLGPNARLYFQPNGTYAGTMASAISFRAWDRSGGTEGNKVSTASNGGSTPFSTDIDTAALTVRPSYSLTSPDSAFSPLLVGNRFDPASDTQANSSDLDLYGQNGTPLLYGAYDATENDLFYRVRIDNPTMSKGVPVFTAVTLLGIDADGDGNLDIFVGVDGRNGGLGVVTYDPGSGANNSPSTTSITNQRSVSDSGTTTPAKAGYMDYALAGSDLGGDGKTDAYLTFRVPFEILQQRLQEAGVNITPSSNLSFVLMTLTQNNSINGDIGGVGKLTTAQKDITWNDLGVLNPISFDTPALSDVGGTVTFVENGSALRLAPAATFTDLDGTSYGGGKFAVSLGGVQAGDALSFATVGGISLSGSNVLYNGNIIGSYATDGTTLTLDFTGDFATKAAVQAAMQALTFSNTSDAPASTARTVSFVLTDPEGHASESRSVTVLVTPVNDAPTVTATNLQRTVVNGNTYDVGTATTSNAVILKQGVPAGASIADVDAGAGAVVSATISVPVGVIEVYNGSTLVLGTGSASFGGVTLTGSGTGTITLSGTIADINSFLGGTTAAQLLFQPGTGAANGQVIAATLTVNDLGNSGSGGPLTAAGTLASITVVEEPKIDGNFAGTLVEDNGVNASNQIVATGTLTSSGQPLPNPSVTFQGNTLGSGTALGALQFSGSTWTYTADNTDTRIQNLGPGESIEETFRVQTTINSVLTTAYVRVTIGGVNDAPTVSVIAADPTFSEGTSTPVDLFSSPVVSTIESYQNIREIKLQVGSIGDGETEFVRIDGTLVKLLDGTVATTSGGLTVAVTASGSAATITITSAAGLSTAATATLIDGLAYHNSAEILASATRTIAITSISDTGGTAAGGDDTGELNLSTTVTLAPVNDGPVLNTAPTTIGAGRSFILTDAHLYAADPDNTPTQLTYTVQGVPQYGSFQYSVDGSTGWTSVTSFTQADINAGRVRYVANEGAPNGAIENLTIQISDGALTDSEPFKITIVNTNQAPVPYDSHITATEDTPYTFTLADFLVNDPDVSDTVSFIEVQAAPGVGTLQYLNNGVWTTINGVQQVSAATISAGGLRFTPAGDAHGQAYATFDFKVIDAQGAASASAAAMTIDVTSVNDAPVLAPVAPISFADTSAFDNFTTVTGTLSSSDPDQDDSRIYGLVGATVVNNPTLPHDLVLEGIYGTLYLTRGSGAYAYIPNQAAINALKAGESAVESFTLTVTDGAGASDTKSLVINLSGAEDAAVISGSRAVALSEDATLPASGMLIVTDADSGEAGFQTPDPSELQGTYGNFSFDTGTGMWSYSLNAPAANVQGLRPDQSVTDTLTVFSVDGTQQSITVTINGTNDAPVLAAIAAVSLVDTNAADSFADVTGTLSATDADIGDNRSFGLPGATVGMVMVSGGAYDLTRVGTYGTLYVNSLTGAYRFVANAAAINALDAGEDPVESFTIRVSDSAGAFSTEDLIIDLTGANDAPTAGNDTVETAEDQPLSGTLPAASDPDVGDSVSYAKASDPAHGSVVVNADGTYTYTPAANYSGPDSFTYTVSDGLGGSNTYTVTVSVTPVNDAPAAVGDIVTTLEGALATFDVRTNDSDQDGGTLTVVAIDGLPIAPGASVATPAGVFTLGGDGRLTFAPAADFTGTSSFTYTISDGQGATRTASLTVDVRAVPVLPVVNPPIVAAPVLPPAPPPVVIEPLAPQPAPTQVFAMPNVTVATNGFTSTSDALLAALDVNPIYTDSGGYQIMVLPSEEQALVLYRGVPDQEFDGLAVIRFSVPMDAFAHTKSDATIALNATLLDGSPLPGWLTFNSQKGIFEGMPPKGMTGEFSIRIVASDQQGKKAATVFRVRVNGASAVESGTEDRVAEGKPRAVKRATPVSLAESRVAADIRARAAKLIGRL